MGKLLREGLIKLRHKHGLIGDIRGRGLLQGIEIMAPKESNLKGDKLGALVAD